jgi:hypothetical protein
MPSLKGLFDRLARGIFSRAGSNSSSRRAREKRFLK